jgi:hypothetical protein
LKKLKESILLLDEFFKSAFLEMFGERWTAGAS